MKSLRRNEMLGNWVTSRLVTDWLMNLRIENKRSILYIQVAVDWD